MTLGRRFDGRVAIVTGGGGDVGRATACRLAAEGRAVADQFAAERLLPWAIEPHELAGVVAWLASDEARSITGQTIVMAG